MSNNKPVSIVLQIELPNEVAEELFEMYLHDCLKLGKADAFYFLTRNGEAIHHRDAHLEPENKLGKAIAALQTGELFFSDTKKQSQ